MSTKKSPARLALIGLSGYGRVHLELARESSDRGDAVITAATVINPDEEAANIAELQERGCRIYRDHQSMFAAEAGKIDLCLIPTGIHWHARMTIAALLAGANVLVEKPLAGSLAEVEAVRATERATGRFVAVGFQDLYDPSTRWLRAELARGAIGRVESVRFLGSWPRSRAYFSRNEWAGRTEFGGVPVLDSPLNNAFAHFVLLSLFFADPTAALPTAAVLDSVELWRAHAIPSFDTAVVAGHTAGGVRLWFGVTHAGGETIEPEIVIHGSEGVACWRYEREACLCGPTGLKGHRTVPGTSETRRTMMAAVLGRLTNPTVPICDVPMAAQHTALIESVHRLAPIRNFASEQIRWSAEKGSSVPEVIGLAAALRTAFAAQGPLGWTQRLTPAEPTK